ncbi:MAG: radical SAM family heme chaperone HemW [Dehalococcoidia bacterium]|nr:radical SAM family heme chaperone HemW [Dehalococcoidia bacterium]
MALYVHVPFCATKCRYCDFNAYARMERLIPAFVEALLRELEAWSGILGPVRVPTIFFGGGTPSLLPSGDVARFLDAARRVFSLDPAAEVSLEANPDDVTEARLRQLRESGVNRLSMGVQSFDDGLLRSLDRRHTAAEAAEAFQMARAAGFDNINLDLIYGLCGQTLAQWEATLERAVALRPEHLSLYALTIEEHTPLWDDVRRGRSPEPDPDLAADMYVMAEDRLAAVGYRHYEISNWVLPGRACRHNLVYWRNQPYLGLGPGAHSRIGAYRFHDVLSPAEYTRRAAGLSIAAGPQPLSAEVVRGLPTVAGVDEVSAATDAADTLILGLRLDEGVDAGDVARRFPDAEVGRWDSVIREMCAAGLLEREGGVLRLTRRGRLLGNEVFLRFLPG